jgi:glycosyltransferase involved in cell wall biosynthesis
MVKPMQISVIIPTFNRRHVLGRALDSVLAQTHPPAEVIVVDDGSRDDTVDFVKTNYPQVQLIRQSNHGVSHARNRGMEVASHDWIALLDSDDAWQADKLEKQSQALQAAPEFLLCHTDEIWYRHNRFVNPKKHHAKSGGWIFPTCLKLCAISPSAVLFHRRLIDMVGMFDESLPACEDYDLWLRVTARYPVLYLPERLTIKYGGHDDQLSQKYWGMDRFRIAAIEKCLKSDYLSDDYRALATLMLREKLNIYLNGAKKRSKGNEVDTYERLLEQYSE